MKVRRKKVKGERKKVRGERWKFSEIRNQKSEMNGWGHSAFTLVILLLVTLRLRRPGRMCLGHAMDCLGGWAFGKSLRKGRSRSPFAKG
ncbi:hypothetical protein [Rubritalea tangerina]|uniref:hypothetical protein n=1 Tax=Rubritalea tangerina TaxID=430798 RepID=UPI003621D28D